MTMKRVLRSFLFAAVIIISGIALSCKAGGAGSGIDSEAEAQKASKIVFQSLNVSYGTGGSKAYTSTFTYESPQGGSVTYTFNTADYDDNSYSYDVTFNDFQFTYVDENNNQETYTMDGTLTFTFSWDITDTTYSWIYNISSSAITLTGPDVTDTFPVNITYTYSVSSSGTSYTITASGTVDGIPIDGYTYTWSY
jgi:hypothetical protein